MKKVLVHLRCLYFFTVIIAASITACQTPNAPIKGFVGEQLVILCRIHYPNLQEQEIFLTLNGKKIITIRLVLDKTGKLSGAASCIEDANLYLKQICESQMKSSALDGDCVRFVIDQVPAKMNGMVSQCGTGHGYLTPNPMRDPEKNITLIAVTQTGPTAATNTTASTDVTTHPGTTVKRDITSTVETNITLPNNVTTPPETIPAIIKKDHKKTSLAGLWALLVITVELILILICSCCPNILPRRCQNTESDTNANRNETQMERLAGSDHSVS